MKRFLKGGWVVMLFLCIVVSPILFGCEPVAQNVTAEGYRIIETREVWKVWVKVGEAMVVGGLDENLEYRTIEKCYIDFSNQNPWFSGGELVKIHDPDGSVIHIFPPHVVTRTSRAFVQLVEKEVLQKQITSTTVREWVDKK